MRTVFNPFGLLVRSTATSKPSLFAHVSTQPKISGSGFEIRKTKALRQPSASKIPARNPRHQSTLGTTGHLTSGGTMAVISLAIGLEVTGALLLIVTEFLNQLQRTPQEDA